MSGMADLELLSAMIISNTWLFRDSGRVFLIDCGHALERPTLALELYRRKLHRGGLTALLLTHRHSDHAGNAAWLRKKTGAPVFCHENDQPALTGLRKAPSLSGHGEKGLHALLCHVEDYLPARSPVDGVYPGRLAEWGFRVIPAFGHTEGSVMLYHEASATLFTGDALLTAIPPSRKKERLGLAVTDYSLDVQACHRQTVDFLRNCPPIRRIAPGHGPLIAQNADAKLEAFLKDPREAITL